MFWYFLINYVKVIVCLWECRFLMFLIIYASYSGHIVHIFKRWSLLRCMQYELSFFSNVLRSIEVYFFKYSEQLKWKSFFRTFHFPLSFSQIVKPTTSNDHSITTFNRSLLFQSKVKLWYWFFRLGSSLIISFGLGVLICLLCKLLSCGWL